MTSSDVRICCVSSNVTFAKKSFGRLIITSCPADDRAELCSNDLRQRPPHLGKGLAIFMAEANRGGMTVFGSGETRRCLVTRAATEVRKNSRNAEKQRQDFLSKFSREHQARIGRVRQTLGQSLPSAHELVHDN